ncbi:sensor histidine kinase [Cohnella cellulosilytica]|uniref:histidine kinase n=1 Tax=Cohnella cellulosilytica TaxID=986710 RepID=A0ABW2FN35_9BACL
MERLDNDKAEWARQWRNPPNRRLALILSALLLLFLGSSLLYSHHSAEKLKKEWLDREAALLGSLAEERPEWAEEWFALLAASEEASPSLTAQGRRLLERYGMSAETDARWLPAIGDYRSRTTRTLLIGGGLFFALAAVLLYRENVRQSRVLRKLAVAMEDAVKRNEPISYRLYEEGDIGLLASGAQELSQRLKETIDQLRREKLFLKETVADISHQLKTPLASLMIYTDLLQETQLDELHAAEFIGRCRRELDRMEWLTQTLLKLARLEADALELNVKTAPLIDTVKQSIHSVQRLAEDKSIRILVGDSDLSLSIPHDAHWLGEALSNLLKNAIEHGPPGSDIVVEWEQTLTFTHLQVKDQGPGIDPLHLPHIFKKFYRTSGEGSGVGLGLPLARLILEKHGGVLSATSGAAGGTIFHATLPLHPFPSKTANLTKL